MRSPSGSARFAPPGRRRRRLLILVEPGAEDLPLPEIAHPGDVGFDQYVAADTVIPPGTHLPPTDVPVNFRVKLPEGISARIESRSSTYGRFPALRLCSAPIDEGYTGPLSPRFQNLGKKPVTIARGLSLTQLVLQKSVVPEFRVVRELPKTKRGAKRYGSTGK